MVGFHLDPSNRLATMHQRHRQDRTTVVRLHAKNSDYAKLAGCQFLSEIKGTVCSGSFAARPARFAGIAGWPPARCCSISSVWLTYLLSRSGYVCVCEVTRCFAKDRSAFGSKVLKLLFVTCDGLLRYHMVRLFLFFLSNVALFFGWLA